MAHLDLSRKRKLHANAQQSVSIRHQATALPVGLLPTARILTFGYDANVADWKGMVSQTRIANHAGKLLSSLAAYWDDDDTLGRLWRLRNSNPGHTPKNTLRSTHGIAFLRTPHRGASLAEWAELLASHLVMAKQTNGMIADVRKQESEF
ncbi:hypothetical protein PG997_002674 [Apiospora hydei]|uniref:Uncharacterized protein n=1 Tax=Apiospora hydei TaxID=1337664 RepID=A0ABR1WX19_9PEZI